MVRLIYNVKLAISPSRGVHELMRSNISGWFKYIWVIVAIFSPIASADIYKCVNVQGKTTFSDFPCANDAVKVEIRDTLSTSNRNSNTSMQMEKGTAMVTLLNGDAHIQLITRTMYCYKGLTTYQGPKLVLPSGLRIPFKNITKIRNVVSADISKNITMHVTTIDGKEISEKLTKPWLHIVGDNSFGRFNKEIKEISSIDFF